MTIALLCGSKKGGAERPQARSACRELLKIAEEGVCDAGHIPVFLDIQPMTLPWFDGRPAPAYEMPDALALHEQISRAPAVILGVPAYWGGVGGAMKNVLDVLGGAAYDAAERTTPLTDKMVGMIIVGAHGGDGANALTQMRTVLAAMGAWSIPDNVVVDNPRDAPHMERVVEDAFRLGRMLARMVGS